MTAVAGLAQWGDTRRQLEADRLPLVYAAYREGEHRVAELARLAGVSRDTIYRDLKACGVKFGHRT